MIHQARISSFEALAKAFDSLDDALIILDNEGIILLANEAAKKLSREFFEPFDIGAPLIASKNLEASFIIKNIIEEVQLKRTPEKYFTEIKSLNGTRAFLEFNFAPVIREADIKTDILLFIRDITAQKVFEKRLFAQASNITNLLERANAIIIGLDTRGYVIDWNEHCMKITGFTKNEVYAQKFADVLLKDIGHEKFDKVVEKVLHREPLAIQELVIRAKMGNLITLLLSSTPRLSVSDKVIGLTLVGQDITELAEYRITLERKVIESTRELRRALQKEKEVVEIKSRFVSIASHEFRLPLSSIQFQTNFIRRTKEQISHDDLDARLNSIENQVLRMSTLLDDVLTYSKCELGKIPLVLSKIMLTNFLDKIIEEVSHCAKMSTHVIRTEYSFIPLAITSDERLLRSILVNLLTNAIKFSPGKENVYLTGECSGSQIILSVRDEGLGIPDDEIKEIFEPFLRGKSATSTPGTGLGLSIVKKSIELLRGTIHTKSQVGKGTTFTIIIPSQYD